MDIPVYIMLTGVLFIASFTDICYRKIPNRLTFPSAAIAVTYHFVFGGVYGGLLSLGGLAIGISLFILPYSKGGMGGGDVKLMGVVGASLNPKGVFMAALFTAIIGGVFALCILSIYKFKQWRLGTMTAGNGVFPLLTLTGHSRFPLVPYGVVIALGTILYMCSVYLNVQIFDIFNSIITFSRLA